VRPRNLAKSIRWAATGTITAQGAAFVRLFLVAGVTSLSDFGTYAVAASIAAAAGIFADGGLKYLYVTRLAELSAGDESQLLGTTWLGILIARVAIVLATVPVALMTAMFVSTSTHLLVGVSLALASSSVLSACANPALLKLEREGEFSPSVYCDMVGQVSALTAVCLLLMVWHSIWLIPIGQIMAAAVSAAISYKLPHDRPPKTFSLPLLGKLALQGRPYAVISLATYVTNGLDKLLLGSMVSPAASGIYLLAQKIAEAPGQMHISTLARVATPHYASNLASSESGWLKRTVHRYLLVTLVLFLIAFTMLLSAKEVVHAFLPSCKWIEAINLSLVILFGCAARSCCHIVSPALAVIDRMDIDAKLKVVESAVYAIVLFLAIRSFGIIGAACAFVLVYAVALLGRYTALRLVASR
jgi:O-antigen/teichoic acid export membrane protein